MVINRTKNTITGTFFGTINKLLTLLFPFIIRTIFIKTIGIEYLGLNSLFTSILQVLNLAELGVGSALVFSMYKPIVDNDETKICALMNLYKKYYRIIGIIVLAIGLAILPFLRLLINGDVPSDINIYILYGMHLGATVLTYWLFAYRNSLFQAHQRLDVVSIVSIVVSIVQFSLQIVALLVSKNYYFYLSITIVSQILINIIVALLSKRFYPNYFPQGELSKEEKSTINGKVRDLFTAKLGGVISNSFDTIVISSFLGLTILAVYQNYFYIVSALTGVIMIFFSSVQAGIGNYLITKSVDDSKQLFYNINYITFFFVAVCCCCLVTMYQPFMTIWVGEEFLLEYPLVIMFVVYFFTYMFVRPLLVFKDAGGMWREDRFRPLVTSLINLSLNLVTIHWLGLYGVLGSTIVSFLFVGFPWLLYNVNKHMFNINVKKYLTKCLMYLLVISASAFFCYLICININIENMILELFLNFIISFILPCIMFFAIFLFTSENKYFVTTIKSFCLRIRKRINTND